MTPLFKKLLGFLSAPSAPAVCDNGSILLDGRQFHGVALAIPRKVDGLRTIIIRLVGQAGAFDRFGIGGFHCGVGMANIDDQDFGSVGGDEFF